MVFRNQQEKLEQQLYFVILEKEIQTIHNTTYKNAFTIDHINCFSFSLWFSQKEKGKMNNDQKREMYVQVQW